MSYLFYLDGTLYENPSEDRDLRTTLKRNSNLNGILVTQDAKVSFTGDAYTYLYDTFFAGLCDEVDVEIWEVCDDYSYFVYGGVIKIADIKIDFQRCKVEASIEDNSFFSYINNNKSIKVRIDQGSKTKTGEDLTRPEIYDLSIFDPCVGTLSKTIKAWRVFDVMQYILDYITDNRVELRSDLLSGEGDEYELFITNGVSLRTGLLANLTEVELSFKELYEAIQRIYNVAFRIENSDYGYERNVIRIEKQDYFYGTQGDLLLPDVKDLEISSDESEIYSSISVGGGDQDGVSQPGVCNTGVSSSVESDLYGWGQADLHLYGQCNTDNELDLTHDFQIASNVIEDVGYRSSLDFEEDLFFIESENVDSSLLTADAVVYDFYGAATPPFYYNLSLNNTKCLQRWGDYIHNSIQQYITSQIGQFRATKATISINTSQAGVSTATPLNPSVTNYYDPSTPAPFDVIYDDDTGAGNFNNGGNYSTVTGQYTCPTTGDYTFTHKLRLVVEGLKDGQTSGACVSPLGQTDPDYIEVIAGITNTVSGQSPTAISKWEGSFGNGISDVTISLPMSCTAGDTVEPFIIIKFFRGCVLTTHLLQLTLLSTSYFGCSASPDSGGNVQTVDTSSFKSLLFKFDYPLDGTTFRDVMDDPTQLIRITSNDSTFVGWIDELKYGWEGKAQITLRANAIIQDT